MFLIRFPPPKSKIVTSKRPCFRSILENPTVGATSSGDSVRDQRRKPSVKSCLSYFKRILHFDFCSTICILNTWSKPSLLSDTTLLTTYFTLIFSFSQDNFKLTHYSQPIILHWFNTRRKKKGQFLIFNTTVKMNCSFYFYTQPYPRCSLLNSYTAFVWY